MSEFSWFSFSDASLQSWLKQEAVGKGLKVEISANGKLLLICSGFSDDFKVEIKDRDETKDRKKSLVMSALTMSAFLNQQFSYTGGTFDNPIEEKDTYDIGEFKKWLPSFMKAKVLVPDTNAIMNCSLSYFKFIMDLDFFKSLSIQIPRLLVLELERKANPKDNSEKSYLEKREVMLAYQELIYLRNSGAKFLPKLDKDTFEGFYPAAGQQMTDSWIRREIHEATQRRQGHGHNDRLVFFTSDLTSALSGIAEGLDTIYVSRMSREDKLLRHGNIAQVSRLIVTMAALYNEIDVTINSNPFMFNGMWSGKTTTEWIDYVVLYKPKNRVSL